MGGAQIHELAAVVTSQVGEFVSGMKQMAKETRGTREEWVKTGREISKAADKLARAVDRLTKRINTGAIQAFQQLRAEAVATGGVMDAVAVKTRAAATAMAAAGTGVTSAISTLPATLTVAVSSLHALADVQRTIARIGTTQLVPAFRGFGNEIIQVGQSISTRVVPAFRMLADETIIDVEFTKRTVPLLEDLTVAKRRLADVIRQRLLSALAAFRNSLSDLGTRALPMVKSGIQSMASSLPSVARAWRRAAGDMLSAVDRIGTTITLVGAAVGGAVAKMGINFLRMKEEAHIAFTTLLGDAGKAKAFFKDIQQFAKNTPFSLEGLAETSKQLLAVGFSAEQILPMVRRVGDAVSVLGGGAERMERITRALSQIQAKGRVQMEEVLQLSEAGISALKDIAQYMGITVPEAMKRMEKGAIDSGTAINAIMEGLRRFEGGMEERSQSLTGQWERFVENINESSGKIVEGLFTELGSFFTNLNRAFDQGQFNVFIDDAAKSVAGLIQRLKAAWPEIRATATELWAFIKPVLKYIAESPNLLKALLVLKAGQTFGITQALTSMGAAVFETVKAFRDMRKEMKETGKEGKSLSTIMQSMFSPAGVFTVGVGILIAMSSSFETLGNSVDPLSEQFERLNGVMQRGIDLMRERAGLARQGGPEMTKANLEQLKAEQSRVDSLILAEQEKLNRKEQEGEDIAGIIGEGVTFGNLDTANDIEVENSRRTLESLKAQAEAIADEIKSSEISLKDQSQQPQQSQQGQQAWQQNSEASRMAEQAADLEKEAKAREDAYQSMLGRETPGYSQIRDVLGVPGVGGAGVARMASSLGVDGLDEALAQGLGAAFDRLGSGATAAQLDALALEFAQVADGAARATEAENQRTEAMAEFEQTLATSTEGLAPGRVEEFREQAYALGESLMNGSITTEQYRESLNNVSNAAVDAAAANNSAAEAARRANEQTRIKAQEDALARGDFAGAGLTPDIFWGDVQFKLRERLMEFYQNQWTSSIDAVVNAMMGVKPAVNDMMGGLKDFGGNVRGMFGSGGSLDMGQAANTLQTYFNSIAGQIALVQNNLALQEQALRYSSGENRREIEDTIKHLRETLDSLLNTPPVFSGLSGDGFFVDPGLETNQGRGGGGSVAISLPNISRLGQSEAAQVAALAASGMEQAGRSFW